MRRDAGGGRRRMGPAPLMRAGAARRVLVVLDADLVRMLDSYGRRNAMPSRSYVLRLAARELLGRERKEGAA